MADLFAYLDGFGTGGGFNKSVIIVSTVTGSTVTATGYAGNAALYVDPLCTSQSYSPAFKTRLNPIGVGKEIFIVAEIEASARTRCYLQENQGFGSEREYFDLKQGKNVLFVQRTVDGAIENPIYFFHKASIDGGDTAQICGKSLKVFTVKIVKTAREKNGEWRFNGLDLGTWTLRAEKSGYSPAVLEFKITEFGVYRVALNYAKVYGIQRDITIQSPEWARTDDAVGLTATASVGTVAGNSDFDGLYPWSGISRETLPTSDVMVKIPKFWFRRYRDGNMEHIQIADGPAPNFELHPAFERYGKEKDYIYVGAYKTSSNNKSVSGATPQTNQTLGTMRANATAKGSGWGLIDIGAVSAVQMLILTEFASNDVQTVIGYGYGYSHNSPLKTGTCNNVPNLTGSPAGSVRSTDVVWRGIEGFWGNIFEFVDGLFYDNGIYKVCNTPSEYSSSVTDAYTPLSYTVAKGLTNQFIKQEGLDSGANKHVILPEIASGGSGSTFECDICSTAASGVKVPIRGGYYQESPQYGNGLFMCSLDFDTSATNGRVSSRLLYIPEVA